MDDKVRATERYGTTRFDEPLRCDVDVDTSSTPPGDQFDLFRSWHRDVAEPELLQERDHSFPAHEMVWDLGTLTIMFLELPGNGYRQRWRHLKKPKIDNWYLSLALSGSGKAGESLQAGKIGLQSLAAPFECVTEDDAFIALFMPCNLDFIQSARMEIREESKEFLRDYMLLLHRSLADLRIADVPHIVAATTSLLAACLSPSRDHLVEAQRVIEAVIMERASKIVAKSLADPGLTPDALCRDLGVSRSQLYRIFEPVGGVWSYIRRKRLVRTRDMLADISDSRPISAIAEAWGFTDPSTFSRMFRREFGITPREARVEGWQNAKPASFRHLRQPGDKTRTLSDLLLGNYLERPRPSG